MRDSLSCWPTLPHCTHSMDCMHSMDCVHSMDYVHCTHCRLCALCALADGEQCGLLRLLLSLVVLFNNSLSLLFWPPHTRPASRSLSVSLSQSIIIIIRLQCLSVSLPLLTRLCCACDKMIYRPANSFSALVLRPILHCLPFGAGRARIFSSRGRLLGLALSL